MRVVLVDIIENITELLIESEIDDQLTFFSVILKKIRDRNYLIMLMVDKPQLQQKKIWFLENNENLDMEPDQKMKKIDKEKYFPIVFRILDKIIGEQIPINYEWTTIPMANM